MNQRTVLLISADEWGWTDLKDVLNEMPELTVASEAPRAYAGMDSRATFLHASLFNIRTHGLLERR